MKTTASKTVGSTGMFSVGYVQSGRQNSKRFVVTAGSKVVGGGVQGGKDAAVKLAERCDRLVAMWRACGK